MPTVNRAAQRELRTRLWGLALIDFVVVMGLISTYAGSSPGSRWLIISVAVLIQLTMLGAAWEMRREHQRVLRADAARRAELDA